MIAHAVNSPVSFLALVLVAVCAVIVCAVIEGREQ